MHMSHITSDRGDDLERSNRMAEYERESMIRLYAYYLAEHRGFAAGHEMKTGSLQNVSGRRSSRRVLESTAVVI